jgi:hypothetical protein
MNWRDGVNTKYTKVSRSARSFFFVTVLAASYTVTTAIGSVISTLKPPSLRLPAAILPL